MRAFLVIIALLPWTASSRGAGVRSPANVGIPNASGGEVFIVPSTFAPSARSQQVFGASDFSNLGTPKLLISDITFNVDSQFMFETRFLDNVQIDFSTTTRNPDDLSTTYASNVGPDETIVYSGPLAIGAGPSTDFLIHIHFQAAFLYEPSAGNLLMDVRNFMAAPPPRFPPNAAIYAWNIAGDTTSTVYGYDVDSSTASFLTTKGLAAGFTYTPVPEPSSAVLLLVGVAALTWARLKRSNRIAPNIHLRMKEGTDKECH